ncbi:chemotaxis protein CheW [Waterburya agarophytonicola K14]|uniref:Chemotaxis protein CheW n=1 Tax=Waterburya agarophytonicola KI4 TaxID=2874699 RepID=A0A964FHJ5_9CYAN|nr:chemotaxis protein CheW [Waterburya agarophytonicola]MCC0179112.1 chemotaxis protein CheW [Waterburya agarophytonicola KI4]
MLSTSANSLSLNFASNTGVQSDSKQVRKFLQFQLGKTEKSHKSVIQGDIALLDAEIVTEVITISPEDILPVPQMFYCVLGIYGWRSEMLWIVDLENLLGYPPPLDNNQTSRELLVMVIQVQGQSIGLVVSGIDNLIEHDLSKFKSSSTEIFSEDVLPFLHGYFTSAENDIIMLIDAEEILNFFSIKTEFNYSQ